MGHLHEAFRDQREPVRRNVRGTQSPDDIYRRELDEKDAARSVVVDALKERSSAPFSMYGIGPEEEAVLMQEFGALPLYAVTARYENGERALAAYANGEAHVWIIQV